MYWVREEVKWLLLSADDCKRLEIMDRIISLVSKHVTRNEARMRTNLTSHPSNEVWWRQLQSPYFFKEEQSTSGRKLVFIINTSAKLIRWSLITCRVSETSHLWADFKTRPNQYFMLRGLKQAADEVICSLLSLLFFPSSSSLPSALFLRMTYQNQTCRSDICDRSNPRIQIIWRRGNLYLKVFPHCI